MKRILLLPLCAALSISVSSCGKRQTQAERDAEVERQVRQRLNTEHQVEEQQKLAQRQAELDARERALKEKEKQPTPQPTVTTSSTTIESRPATPETTTYSTFYRKLEPYGDWIDTSSYGYVWQPRPAAQSRNWRPYTNGHWVYTDAGWTWISEEPFGWATYHYGRWLRLRGTGWVWVPGNDWAPAWVSWRKGNDYIGWAPLPPEAHFDRRTGIQNWADSSYDIGPEQYTFVPANEFGSQLSSRQIIPTARNVTIINQTTNVTNIIYHNSTVVDRGPSYDDLGARSRQPLEQLRLERTQNLDEERPVIRGEVVSMPAPDFRPAEPAARPERVARLIAQPKVDRGWGGIHNMLAAEKARARMRSEATAPNPTPLSFVRPTAPAVSATPASKATPAPTATPAPNVSASPPVAALSDVGRLRRKAARQGSQNLTPQQKEEKRLLDQQQRRGEKRRILLERQGQNPAVTATPSPAQTAPAAATVPSPSATASLAPVAPPRTTASPTPTPP